MRTKHTLTQREILTSLKRHQNILNKYKVKKIGLFGSYAKSKQGKGSDIDFLVEFKEPTFDNFINLVNYLEKLFGKKIDVLTPGGINAIRVKEVAENIKKSVVYA